MQPNYRRTRNACYFSYVSTASIFSLPPLLFVTFREMYGVSYTLLGTLVLINFLTQLTMDLLFSFFPRLFNIKKTLRGMPLLVTAGLTTYALIPTFFSQHAYAGLVAGTVLFSMAAGLSEALLSPTVAALPSDNPDRDMSRFHSLYAYGVLMVVVVSTVFLKVFGTHNWMYLTLIWAALPLGTFALFCTSPIPPMNLTHNPSAADSGKRRIGMLLCALCIFFGSAAENTMTNWISSYMERALGISKAVGDVLGLAIFAVLLGLTRTVYGKYGRNISRVLMVSMIGAVACYLTVGLMDNVVICMFACVLTGVFTSMLWPGALILMEEKMPAPGVAAYALMAAAGDFGGSVGPQMMGALVDAVSAGEWAAGFSQTMGLSVEQIGMKVGMLAASAFPIVGVVVLVYIRKYFRKAAVM